jgi:hypothetical protein
MQVSGITTVITGTITIGMTAKTAPIVYTSARGIENITRSLKCEWETRELIGDGVIIIRIMIETEATQ